MTHPHGAGGPGCSSPEPPCSRSVPPVPLSRCGAETRVLEPPTGSTLPTAGVVRTDLADRTEVDGTLGYAHTYTVLAGGAGRLTWLPAVGTVIRRGQRVYDVDGHRVPLLYGAIPLWRTLRSGVSNGRDVLELERNLADARIRLRPDGRPPLHLRDQAGRQGLAGRPGRHGDRLRTTRGRGRPARPRSG